MGLAASQARLLFITSRQNDVSAKMQRISNQTMILARDEEEISDKYNRMLNEKVYKLKDTDLSYNTLMGSAAINSGYMNIITNDKGAVVLSDKDASRYGITSNTGGKGDFAKIYDSNVDKFIEYVEGDNAASIIASKPTTPSGDKNKVPTGELSDQDMEILNDFLSEYGSYPTKNKPYNVQNLLTKMGSVSVGGEDNFSKQFNGLTMESIYTKGNWFVEIANDNHSRSIPIDTARKNFVALADAFQAAIMGAMGVGVGSNVEVALTKYKGELTEKINKWSESNEAKSNYENSDNILKTECTAPGRGQDYDKDVMKIDVSQYLKEMLNRALVAVGALEDGAKRGSLMQNNTYFTVMNEKNFGLDDWKKQLEVWFPDKDKCALALEYCKTKATKGSSDSGSSSGRTATNAEKYACYEKLYNSLNSNGWAIEDVSSIMSKLENIESGYRLDGKPISTHEDLYVEDTGAATAKAEAYWKTETAKLSRKEKQLDRELTKLQTEYSSLTTDYESVKSIIQQNVTKSFTYCNNG